jgi:predicted small secreted protein
MTRRIILVLLLLATAVCITGCQTVEGFGGDLKWTGDSIQKAAK